MTAASGPTRLLAEWVESISYAQLPGDVVTAAKRGILDTVAVMLAGARESGTQIVAKTVRLQVAEPVARQLGDRLSTSAFGAALVNGSSGHALDFDDTQANAQGHPSTVVLPAVLAVADALHASGQQVITAYVAGIETMGKIGAALGHAAYSKGWHATSLLGPLASAMAAGKVLALGASDLEAALGIAVSQAGGTRQNFGTMVKPLHAGWAASSGVLAAQLAAEGLTASREILEVPMGMLALYGGKSGESEVRQALILGQFGEPFEIVSPGLGVKRYPCCAATHRALDATFQIREEIAANPGDIAGVDVRLNKGGLAPLIYDRPSTGLQGKFCMRYVVAAALIDGEIAIGTFTDDMVRRRKMQDLLDVIRVTEADVDSGEDHWAEVSLTLKSGAVVTRRVDIPRGSPERPLALAEIQQKFTMCAQNVLPADHASAAREHLHDLERVADIRDVIDLLVP